MKYNILPYISRNPPEFAFFENGESYNEELRLSEGSYLNFEDYFLKIVDIFRKRVERLNKKTQYASFMLVIDVDIVSREFLLSFT